MQFRVPGHSIQDEALSLFYQFLAADCIDFRDKGRDISGGKECCIYWLARISRNRGLAAKPGHKYGRFGPRYSVQCRHLL